MKVLITYRICFSKRIPNQGFIEVKPIFRKEIVKSRYKKLTEKAVESIVEKVKGKVVECVNYKRERKKLFKEWHLLIDQDLSFHEFNLLGLTKLDDD